jgi:hypothetical protein
MSSESTPVLCGSIASFELLMSKWERLGEEHPQLQYWTQIGLRWAEKYYKQMDDTDAYVIAMGRSLFFEDRTMQIHCFLKSSILASVCRGLSASGIHASSREPGRSCLTS